MNFSYHWWSCTDKYIADELNCDWYENQAYKLRWYRSNCLFLSFNNTLLGETLLSNITTLRSWRKAMSEAAMNCKYTPSIRTSVHNIQKNWKVRGSASGYHVVLLAIEKAKPSLVCCVSCERRGKFLYFIFLVLWEFFSGYCDFLPAWKINMCSQATN